MFEHPTGLFQRRIDVSNRDHQHEPGNAAKAGRLRWRRRFDSEEVDEENVIMSHQQHAAD